MANLSQEESYVVQHILCDEGEMTFRGEGSDRVKFIAHTYYTQFLKSSIPRHINKQ